MSDIPSPGNDGAIAIAIACVDKTKAHEVAEQVWNLLTEDYTEVWHLQGASPPDVVADSPLGELSLGDLALVQDGLTAIADEARQRLDRLSYVQSSPPVVHLAYLGTLYEQVGKLEDTPQVRFVLDRMRTSIAFLSSAATLVPYSGVYYLPVEEGAPEEQRVADTALETAMDIVHGGVYRTVRMDDVIDIAKFIVDRIREALSSEGPSDTVVPDEEGADEIPDGQGAGGT